MKRLLSGIVLVVMAITVNAATLHVSVAGDNSDGSTWSKAYNTIQAALAVAVTGDEIWVQQGAYVVDSEENQLTFKDGVNVYGGFEGTETALSSRSDNADLTIISHAETVSENFRLLMDSDLNDAATWDGFTFDGKDAGMGVHLSGNCTLNNAVVKNCSGVNGSGIGVYMTEGSGFIPVTLSNCDVKNNRLKVTNTNEYTIGGAGIYVSKGATLAEISDCNITNNNIEGVDGSGALVAYGGGVMLLEGALRNSFIDDNHVMNSANENYKAHSFTGGAIAIIPRKVSEDANVVEIDGCIISNCTSNARGGAIIIDPRYSGDYHGNFTIKKTIIRNNKSNDAGGGIMVTTGTEDQSVGMTLNIENSVIANNSAATGGGVFTNCQMTINFTNVTVVNNESKSTYGGGGLFLQGNARALKECNIKNVLVWGNIQGAASNGRTQINHNYNANNVLFSAIQDYTDGYASWGWGNVIHGDNITLAKSNEGNDAPAFLAPSSGPGYGVSDALTADWHITGSSACVDYGDDYLTEDLEGITRPLGDYSDIGAYEFDASNPPTGIFDTEKAEKQFSVFSVSNGIVVNSEIDGALQVFSITGSLIKTVNVYRGENRIALRSNQLCIVCLNGVAQKVLVK